MFNGGSVVVRLARNSSKIFFNILLVKIWKHKSDSIILYIYIVSEQNENDSNFTALENLVIEHRTYKQGLDIKTKQLPGEQQQQQQRKQKNIYKSKHS